MASGRELRLLRRRNAEPLEYIARPVVAADGRTLAACSSNWVSFFDLDRGDELGSVRLPYQYAATTVFFAPAHPDLALKGTGLGEGWVTGGYAGLFHWPTRPDPARPEVLCVGPVQQFAPGLASAFAHGASASPDGRVVAVPLGSKTIVLHRDRPGSRLELGPQRDVRFSAVSPDGRWVVTCSHFDDVRYKSAWIWDADSGKRVYELPLDGSTLPGFSPDGRWLMTGNADGCRLWEVATWKEVRRFDGLSNFAFSPDSRLLALGDAFSVIRLVEIATGREVARLTGPEPDWYSPACFTPDGTKLIATCASGKGIYVWDLRLIRQQLKELGLDWEWDEFPPADPASKPAPSRVEVDLGDLAKSTLTAEQKARQAIERYRPEVATKPEDALACNNLAWAYLTAPKALCDLKAALPLAEKAVERAPGNGVYRNTLGLAYYRAGRYRDAIELVRPRLDSQEDWCLAFDLYLLAMSHQRLGETARAQDYLDWALRWTRTQPGLSAAQLEDLSMFRAEAERVLNLKEKRE
jgi:TPR repeat protein